MNTKHRNRLGLEKSPYLLQHADNPIDWYPWGEEAFEKAKKDNKPVFLSIGYSTCHWCHVMAHESFEDPDVARLINQTFVAIKVDREERPDIDKVYMTVCQMLTGSGGWPLTIILTPKKEPFFAATYIQKETRFGRVGLLDLIPRIAEFWSTRNDEAWNSARQVTSALKQTKLEAPGTELTEAVLHLAYGQLAERFDERSGGFGEAPKFPAPHNLSFLLRYWKRTHDERALEMVDKTLQAIRRGGIYDHIGFGFHRYSTDARWLVPHFEKMLYDQALLAIAYIEAFQATGREEYSRTAHEIVEYVLRDMTAPQGGFYSAEDADSEGEEGQFYLWTRDEIERVLSQEEAPLALRMFHVDSNGNFTNEIAGQKSGQNILHLTKSMDDAALDLGLSPPQLSIREEVIRRKLFDDRNKRPHPHKDDKILTDWNGLMIGAMAKAAQVFDEPKFANAAKRAADFILNHVRASDGRLLHRYRAGEAALAAHIDDYAFFIYGLLELYETIFDVQYLRTAIELNEDLIRHFWDQESGGFYFTADDDERLLIRQKEDYDGAIPSGNSVAMLNLLRLGRVTTNVNFEEKASKIGQAFSANIGQLPSAYSQLLIALDFAIGPSYEIVIAGNPQAMETKQMLNAIRRLFLPNKIVLLRPTDQESPEIDRIAPFIGHHLSIDGKVTAYICHNYNCLLPITDVDTMPDLLRRLGTKKHNTGSIASFAFKP